jgi:hypothetical protein
MKTIKHEDFMKLSIADKAKLLQSMTKGEIKIEDPYPPKEQRKTFED